MALVETEVEQILRQCWAHLPGASDASTRAALWGVMKEFFTDSNAWREDIEWQAIAATTDYVLTPDGGTIIRLVGTWDDKGIPVPSFMPVFGTVKLLHAPEFNPPTVWFSRLVKTVVLPASATGLPDAPDWTLTVYSEHILDGLLGRMMAHQAQPYSNSKESAYHLKRFRQGIKIARTEADAANLQGAQAWAFPRFMHGSQRGGVSTAWPTRAF